MKVKKTVNNKLKKVAIALTCFFLTTGIYKNANENVKAIKVEQKTNQKSLTTKKFILNKIKKNKDADVEEIVEKYYKLSQSKKNKILSNDRILKRQNKAENLGATEQQLKKINEIEKRIRKKEASYVKKFIELPKKENRKKPIVILNPGHGFEDPGASVKTKENEKILEKTVNAKLCATLTKHLLRQGFEVYLPFKPEGADFEKEEENPSLHILFNKRPPIKGEGNLQRMADASAFCIKQIFAKLNKNIKNAKIASLCIHHNSAANEKAYGFISFYGNDENKISKKFIRKSKKLAEILFKHCGEVYVNTNPDRQYCGAVKVNDYAVCYPGKEAKGSAGLVEIAFMTNNEELAKILSEAENEKMCEAITRALCEYFDIEYVEYKVKKSKKKKKNKKSSEKKYINKNKGSSPKKSKRKIKILT